MGSLREDIQNIGWSAQNTFGNINNGFFMKNPSKDLPRIEISEEFENEYEINKNKIKKSGSNMTDDKKKL